MEDNSQRWRAAGPPLTCGRSAYLAHYECDFPLCFYQHFTKVSRLVFPTSLIQNFLKILKNPNTQKLGFWVFGNPVDILDPPPAFPWFSGISIYDRTQYVRFYFDQHGGKAHGTPLIHWGYLTYSRSQWFGHEALRSEARGFVPDESREPGLRWWL